MYPKLFTIGPFTLHTYGLFLAIAFLVALRVILHYAKRENIESSFVLDLVFYVFLSALIGAKILHIVVDFDYYREDWRRLFSVYQVGGVYFGGLILAVVTALWYMHKRRMNFWRTADVLSMGLAFGQIFGRTGCFLAGCCWGKTASAGFPVAVVFRNAYAAEHVGTPLNIALHPVQLYEAFLLAIVFILMVYFYNHRRFTGQQLALYLFLYSILRFALEYFRGDPRGFWFSDFLSTSQVISVGTFMAAVAIFAVRTRRHKEQPKL